ncbi:MAG: TadE/TadG family type IV pilus assembly protein [Sphingomonadaceae bacterium]
MMRARLAADERGTTAVEFALIAPLLFLLLLGGIEGGRLLFASAALHRAVGLAARDVAMDASENPSADMVARMVGTHMRALAVQQPIPADAVRLSAGSCGLEIAVASHYAPLLLPGFQPVMLRADSCARL